MTRSPKPATHPNALARVCVPMLRPMLAGAQLAEFPVLRRAYGTAAACAAAI
jgi:hypothetical protein